MKTIHSQDGTAIAFDRLGKGPTLILVLGAFNNQATGAPLAARLSKHFTVFNYDRRGRGASGDTPPYTILREIEDLAALIDEAGGSASVFGYSSGALLSLMAAAHGLPITKIALYEPPFLIDDERSQHLKEVEDQLTDLIRSDQRGHAVELFQTRVIGIPVEVVAQLRQAPFRPMLENMAHTLGYETSILRNRFVLTEQFDSILAPTLLISGEQSPAMVCASAQTITDALPHAQHRRLAGQTHDIEVSVLAPVLEKFFAD